MASLRNIMNVDDDHSDSHSLKKPKESGPRPPHHQHPESSTSTSSYANPVDLSMTAASSASSTARGQRLPPSSHPIRSFAAETPLSSSSPSSSLPFPLVHDASGVAPDRRQSNTSTDSMDSPYGQGLSLGQAGASYPGTPMRPFVPDGDVPVKLTPITGRVSRARKGLPVHTCEICRPPKTFTRAEHLRRHQLSHQPADLQCQVPGCDKVFHRRDLLERHQQRHDQDENAAAGAPRRSSSRSYGPGSPGHSSYGGSPSASLLQTPQPFGSPHQSTASTTSTSTHGMHMGSGPWPSTGKPTPRVRDMQEDFTMTGVKREYLTEPMPDLLSVPPRAVPDFSEPRSGPGLGIMDAVPGICISDVDPSTVAWHDSSALDSSQSGSNYSTPASDVSRSHHPVARTSSAEWTAPLDHPAVSSDMQSPIIGTAHYPLPFGYVAASPPQGYPLVYGEGTGIPLSGYDDVLYSSHTTVRSLSPQLAVGQSSETLVTTPSALPADRVVNPLAYGLQPETAFGLLTAQDLMPVTLTGEALGAIPGYLDVYWNMVYPTYPFIHRATFEDASGEDAEHLDVLRCAMAAVATQFLGDREHRINGSLLHAYAWHRSKMLSQSANSSSLPVMQAVLLCEYYARFRGRSKEAYRPSARFNALCQMVANMNNQHALEPSPAAHDNSHAWQAWVRIESCRRLLAACFLLSVHGAWYYEQPLCDALGLHNFSPMMLPIALTASTQLAWAAESADSWGKTKVAATGLQTVGEALQEMLTPASIESMPAFDALLLLAAHALQLPRRRDGSEVDLVEDVSSIRAEDMLIARLFPDSPAGYVYLALHYTPLHCLLSVSGDSWVFNKKMTQASAFAEDQRRLEKWRESGSAAAATWFAAQALNFFLRLEQGPMERAGGQARALPWRDISDFWGVYVCALICWAYGHAGGRPAEGASRGAATRWLLAAAAERAPARLRDRAGREASQGVVGLVHDVLGRDCLGARSILYADAVRVLRKLQEADGWKRF